MEVGHLAGPELDVGAADADAVDIDDDLTRRGDGIGDLFDRAFAGRVDDESPHECRLLAGSGGARPVRDPEPSHAHVGGEQPARSRDIEPVGLPRAAPTQS